jgi:hypothetical protein
MKNKNIIQEDLDDVLEQLENNAFCFEKRLETFVEKEDEANDRMRGKREEITFNISTQGMLQDNGNAENYHFPSQKKMAAFQLMIALHSNDAEAFKQEMRSYLITDLAQLVPTLFQEAAKRSSWAVVKVLLDEYSLALFADVALLHGLLIKLIKEKQYDLLSSIAARKDFILPQGILGVLLYDMDKEALKILLKSPNAYVDQPLKAVEAIAQKMQIPGDPINLPIDFDLLEQIVDVVPLEKRDDFCAKAAKMFSKNQNLGSIQVLFFFAEKRLKEQSKESLIKMTLPLLPLAKLQPALFEYLLATIKPILNDPQQIERLHNNVVTNLLKNALEDNKLFDALKGTLLFQQKECIEGIMSVHGGKFLRTACTDKKLEAVKFILSYSSVLVNEQDGKGNTALHLD